MLFMLEFDYSSLNSFLAKSKLVSQQIKLGGSHVNLFLPHIPILCFLKAPKKTKIGHWPEIG